MKKRIRFFKMFTYDAVNNFIRNRYVYIMLLLLIVVAGMYYSNRSRILNFDEEIGFIEYLLHYQRGIEKIDISRENVIFELPIMYLGLAITFSIITGNNLLGDSSYTVLMRGKSKSAWTVCKAISASLTVVFTYLMMFVCALIYGEHTRTVVLKRCDKVLKIDKVNPEVTDNMLLFVVFFIAPVLTSIAITQVQSVVSLLFGNVTGFIVVMSIYVLSIFNVNELWLGNGCMVQRYTYFLEGGIKVSYVIIVSLVVIIVAFFAQLAIVSKKDWLS